jgi:glutathione synthase/RimK-type ligase-like ATP-grasp enzyme
MSDLISRASYARRPGPVQVALVTALEARDLDPDMAPLTTALRAAGAAVSMPCWHDPEIDWSRYDVALLRSTWDYVDRIDEFLAWCDHCASHTRLLNRPDVVRWNTDKHYLLDLAREGVPVVPTRFVEPGDDARAALDAFLAGGASFLAAGESAGESCEFAEFVVKPAIGAGSRDAARYRRDEAGQARAHLERLLAAGRSTMLQPYLERVDQHGETAVLYLGGRFSHAARKGPLLRPGAALVEGLFAPEDIRARAADPAELEVAAAAYAAVPFDPPVYARIDLLRDARGAPAVLELELTEPSLFLAHAPGAAESFAEHLVHSVRVAPPAEAATVNASRG